MLLIAIAWENPDNGPVSSARTAYVASVHLGRDHGADSPPALSTLRKQKTGTSSATTTRPSTVMLFGDTINGYTWDNGNVEEFKKSKLYGANCRLGIEVTKKNMTREFAREVIDAGFFAAVFALNEQVSYSEYEELMDWGVTEFTEDHHCSMGLNW